MGTAYFFPDPSFNDEMLCWDRGAGGKSFWSLVDASPGGHVVVRLGASNNTDAVLQWTACHSVPAGPPPPGTL